jgi:glutamate racemase
MKQSDAIDTILLACTHYPLLIDKIRKYTPDNIKIITQGHIVAESLKNYLVHHPEIEIKCGKTARVDLYTTDSTTDFDKHSAAFFGQALPSNHAIPDQ